MNNQKIKRTCEHVFHDGPKGGQVCGVTIRNKDSVDRCAKHKMCQHGCRHAKCAICSKRKCPCGITKTKCYKCDYLGWLRSDLNYRIWLMSNDSEVMIEDLGCSKKKFREHISSMWKPDMNWANYGDLWQIDHLTPIKYPGGTDEERKRRFHYTNCAPLYKLDNIKKSNLFDNGKPWNDDSD